MSERVLWGLFFSLVMFSLTLEYKKRRRITVMEAKLLTLVTAFTTRPSGELKDFVNLLLKRSTLLASA